MKTADRPVALVTGAAGALGTALVEQLMVSGRDCVALDRNRRALEKMHDRLAAEGSAPLVVPLDLAGCGPDSFAELTEHLQSEFGRLDLMIHAAAEFRALTPLEHLPPEDWMQCLQAGLTGSLLLVQALLPMMRETAGSRMIWVVDAPEEKAAYWGAYGVVQSGRVGMARILAAECRVDGPQVQVVDPGPFYSPLRSRAWPAEDPESLPSAAEAAARVLAAAGIPG
ncbi:MAG: SDR family NAD(P)-dependent oxidoreductase [Wenzhouxiangellaceae bacterium]